MKGNKNQDLFPIYDDVEINKIPNPTWLVDQLIADDTLALMYGPTDVGKTFIALDMALCIGTGRHFHGFKTRKAAVVYIYAEGAAGMKLRAQAWKKENGFSSNDFCGVYFIPTSVDFLDPSEYEIKKLITTIESKIEDFSLLWIDTLAKCFSGADEDKTEHMNNFVNQCNSLRNHFKATIGVVHHTGWDERRERGNRALASGFDSKIHIVPTTKEARIILKNERQKDDAPSKPFNLDRVEIELMAKTKTERAVTSCVLRGGGEPIIQKADEKMDKILATLKGFGKFGTTHGIWKSAVLEEDICASSTFNTKVNKLISKEMVTKPQGNPMNDAGFAYKLTELGMVHLDQK